MREFQTLYRARRSEVEQHLAAIDGLTTLLAQGGALRVSLGLDSDQLNILKSGFLVHLYNLVEGMMAKIIDEISGIVVQHKPADLADLVRREWLRSRGGVDAQLTGEERLTRLFELLEEFVGNLPPRKQILRPTSNWSHKEVEAAAMKLGCALNIPDEVNRLACKVHFVDEKPPMLFIRDKRNLLAHGNQSFVEGALTLTPVRLRELMVPILDYLDAVQASFVSYLDERRFLRETGA